MFHILAALALTASDAPAPPVPPTPPVPEAPAPGEGQQTTVVEIHTIQRSGGKAPPTPRATARAMTCEGKKFEFTAATGEGEKKHKSRIVLCSEKDASKERVVTMLEDAARRLETNQKLPAANRDKIVADVRAKIAELQSAD